MSCSYSTALEQIEVRQKFFWWPVSLWDRRTPSPLMNLNATHCYYISSWEFSGDLKRFFKDNRNCIKWLFVLGRKISADHSSVLPPLQRLTFFPIQPTCILLVLFFSRSPWWWLLSRLVQSRLLWPRGMTVLHVGRRPTQCKLYSSLRRTSSNQFFLELPTALACFPALWQHSTILGPAVSVQVAALLTLSVRLETVSNSIYLWFNVTN